MQRWANTQRMPTVAVPKKTKAGLARWLFIYIPVVCIVVAVLYVLLELLITYIAVRAVQ